MANFPVRSISLKLLHSVNNVHKKESYTYIYTLTLQRLPLPLVGVPNHHSSSLRILLLFLLFTLPHSLNSSAPTYSLIQSHSFFNHFPFALLIPHSSTSTSSFLLTFHLSPPHTPSPLKFFLLTTPFCDHFSLHLPFLTPPHSTPSPYPPPPFFFIFPLF